MDLLSDTDLYNFDFNQITQFLDKSDFVRKLNGFMTSQAHILQLELGI